VAIFQNKSIAKKRRYKMQTQGSLPKTHIVEDFWNYVTLQDRHILGCNLDNGWGQHVHDGQLSGCKSVFFQPDRIGDVKGAVPRISWWNATLPVCHVRNKIWKASGATDFNNKCTKHFLIYHHDNAPCFFQIDRIETISSSSQRELMEIRRHTATFSMT